MSILKRKILTTIVSNGIVWAGIEKVAHWSDRIREYKRVIIWEKYDIEKAKKILPELVVKNGPFKGMIYPKLEASGSTIFPKLLGSYERELHPLLETLIKNDYSEVIDIGCAEGYYAVGFAMQMPDTTVFAYDTSMVAQEACNSMAKINHVANRVNVRTTCTPEILRDLKPKTKALIISDCEGYEKTLFSEINIASLAKNDVLIEAHDFIDITTSSYIKNLFLRTHNLQVINSITDHLKVTRYDYKELEGLDYSLKYNILAERRPDVMEWFFFSPKE